MLDLLRLDPAYRRSLTVSLTIYITARSIDPHKSANTISFDPRMPVEEMRSVRVKRNYRTLRCNPVRNKLHRLYEGPFFHRLRNLRSQTAL